MLEMVETEDCIMPGAKIHLWVTKYRLLIYLLLGLPLAIGGTYALCADLLPSSLYLSWSKFQLIFIPLAELFCLFFFLDVYLHNQNSPRSTFAWQLIFYFAALNLALLLLLTDFYRNPDRLQYRSVQLLLKLAPFAVVLLLGGALLAFWLGFSKLIRHEWPAFTFEQSHASARPATRLTGVILLAAFIVGMALRLYHLAGFPPYVDEYIHTHAASRLLHGQPITSNRAFLPVTLPVYLSYRLFGVSLWASRLPMTLLNMLAIFPLYALARKINRSVGYLSVALFVFSPWLLAVSRTVREYAVAPLFFYLSAAFLLDLLDWDGLSLKQYLLSRRFQLVGAALILLYILYDRRSTLQTVLVAYGVFGGLAVLKFFKQSSSRWLKLLVLALGLLLALGLFEQTGLIHRRWLEGGLVSNLAPLYWLSLVHNDLRQWYALPQIGYLVLFTGGLLALRALFQRYNKNDAAVLFCCLVFAALLAYLTLFVAGPHVPIRVRYGSLMEYWYVLVAALFLYILFRLIARVLRNRLATALACLLLFAGLFTNYRALHLALTYPGGDALLITGEKHYLVEPAYRFLAAHLASQDALLTDVLDSYDEIAQQLLHPAETISYYTWVLAEDRSALTVMDQRPRGWIAVGANSLPWEYGLPPNDFIYNGKNVKFHGVLGEIYLWQWGEPAQ